MSFDRGETLDHRYSYYIVALLALTYMVSFMDRVLISILIEPIRAEFALSDTQIGLLIGFGFVLFYSVLGLPFGALADRVNRRNLIVLGLIGWSAATSLSAFAATFTALLVARALVGVGEATLSPAAISTISDRFPPSRVGLALSLYTSGVSIGGGIAMAFGGALAFWASHQQMAVPFLGALSGWRLSMFVVGLVGLPLAALMLLTMREVPRSAKTPPLPFSALTAHIAAHPRAFSGIFIGYSFAAIASYMPSMWAPALFMRVHGLNAQEIGLVFGLIVGVSGFIGVIGGGMISDWLTRRGVVEAPVRVVLWSVVLQLPFLIAAFLLRNTAAALGLLAIGQALVTLFGGLQATTVQLLTPPRLRGRMMALYLLIVTMAGMGLGPLAVGGLSDGVFEGPNALGLAIATVTGISLLVAAVAIATTMRQIRACAAAA